MEKYEVEKFDREKFKNLPGFDGLFYVLGLSAQFKVKTKTFAEDFDKIMESYETMIVLSYPDLYLERTTSMDNINWRIRRKNNVNLHFNVLARFLVSEYSTEINVTLFEKDLELEYDKIEEFDKYNLKHGNFISEPGQRTVFAKIKDFDTFMGFLEVLNSQLDKIK